MATIEYVNELEGRLALEKEGVVVLPGVMDLLQSIPAEDWTVNTAGTNIMAVTRLSQFDIKVPKQMATGDMVKDKVCIRGELKTNLVVNHFLAYTR